MRPPPCAREILVSDHSKPPAGQARACKPVHFRSGSGSRFDPVSRDVDRSCNLPELHCHDCRRRCLSGGPNKIAASRPSLWWSLLTNDYYDFSTPSRQQRHTLLQALRRPALADNGVPISSPWIGTRQRPVAKFGTSRESPEFALGPHLGGSVSRTGTAEQTPISHRLGDNRNPWP